MDFQLQPVPTYSLWDVYLGYGIVGGKLINGYRQGKIAAELVLRILGGQTADDLPVVKASDANQYMFDYRQLVRFNIPCHRCPAMPWSSIGPNPFMRNTRGSYDDCRSLPCAEQPHYHAEYDDYPAAAGRRGAPRKRKEIPQRDRKHTGRILSFRPERPASDGEPLRLRLFGTDTIDAMIGLPFAGSGRTRMGPIGFSRGEGSRQRDGL